jgi:hypothetical protein
LFFFQEEKEEQMDYIRKEQARSLAELVKSSLHDLRSVAFMLVTSVDAFEKGTGEKKFGDVRKFAGDVAELAAGYARGLSGNLLRDGEGVSQGVNCEDSSEVASEVSREVSAASEASKLLEKPDDAYHSNALKHLSKWVNLSEKKADQSTDGEILLDSDESDDGGEFDEYLGGDPALREKMNEARKKLEAAAPVTYPGTDQPPEQSENKKKYKEIIYPSSNIAIQPPGTREKLLKGFYYKAVEIICGKLGQQIGLSLDEAKKIYYEKEKLDGVPYEQIQKMIMREADRQMDLYNAKK